MTGILVDKATIVSCIFLCFLMLTEAQIYNLDRNKIIDDITYIVCTVVCLIIVTFIPAFFECEWGKWQTPFRKKNTTMDQQM